MPSISARSEERVDIGSTLVAARQSLALPGCPAAASVPVLLQQIHLFAGGLQFHDQFRKGPFASEF